MGGVSAEFSAVFSVSHGWNDPLLSINWRKRRSARTPSRRSEDGSFMERCRPRSSNLAPTSLRVVSPKLRTSNNSSSVRMTRSPRS